jgi:hypothetical protein
MSVMEYARHLGVDHAGISRAIARGDIVPLDNGLIDVEQANATYGRRRAQRAALRASNAETAEKCERAALTKTIAKVRKARRLARALRPADCKSLAWLEFHSRALTTFSNFDA